MSRSSLALLVTITVGLFVSACAPGGGDGQGGDPADDPNAKVFATMSLDTRDLAFASGMLVTLSDMRRMLDDSQTLFPNTRQQARPGDVYDFGCRLLKKVSPDPASEQPTTAEQFAVLYNCMDGAKIFSRVDLKGTESYDLAYNEALPRLGEKKDRPLAAKIAVTGDTAYLAHFEPDFAKPTDRVKIARKTTLNAQLNGQSLTDATFDVTLEVDDTYSFDVSKTAREGVFTTKIAARATVDKKTRKVKQLVPSAMTFTVDGTQWDKVTSRSDAERINPVDLKLTGYSFALTQPLNWKDDACELPDAAFSIKKGTDAPVVVTGAAQAGKISIEGLGDNELKACAVDRAADPLFARVLEGLYF